MKSLLGNSSGFTGRSFLGGIGQFGRRALSHVLTIHSAVSLGLKVGNALRPLLPSRGGRARQIADAMHNADTKYHRISDKVENFYYHRKHNIDKLTN